MQTWVVYSLDLSHKSIVVCSQSPKIMANFYFFWWKDLHQPIYAVAHRVMIKQKSIEVVWCYTGYAWQETTHNIDSLVPRLLLVGRVWERSSRILLSHYMCIYCYRGWNVCVCKTHVVYFPVQHQNCVHSTLWVATEVHECVRICIIELHTSDLNSGWELYTYGQ